MKRNCYRALWAFQFVLLCACFPTDDNDVPFTPRGAAVGAACEGSGAPPDTVGWQPQVVIDNALEVGDGEDVQSPPKAAFGRNGVGFGTWSSLDRADNEDQFASRYSVICGWEPPVALASPHFTEHYAEDAVIAANDHGGAIVVWIETKDSPNYVLKANTHTVDDGWSAPEVASRNMFGSVEAHGVGMAADGTAFVLFEARDVPERGTHSTPRVSRYTPGGGWALPIEVNAERVHESRLAVAADGTAIIAYNQAVLSGRPPLYARRYSANAQWSPAVLLDDNALVRHDRFGMVADDDGNAIATWESRAIEPGISCDSSAAGCESALTVRRYIAATDTWLPEEYVYIENGGDSDRDLQTHLDETHLSMNAQGDALISFTVRRGDGSKFVLASISTSNGAWTAPEVVLEWRPGQRNGPDHPVGGISENGSAIVVWENSEDGVSYAAASRYDAVGGWSAAERIANNTFAEDSLVVNMDENGNAVVTMAGDSKSGDRYGFISVRYQAAP